MPQRRFPTPGTTGRTASTRRSTTYAVGLAARVALVTLALVAPTAATAQTPDIANMIERYPDIPADAAPIEFEVIPELTATYSPFEEPFTRVIRDEGAWVSYLADFAGPDGPPPAPAAPSFPGMVVLAVAIGFRPSGGFTAEIEGVFEVDGTLYVAVLETRPGRGCMTSMGLTFPTTAARVAAHTGPVRFLQRTVDRACGDAGS